MTAWILTAMVALSEAQQYGQPYYSTTIPATTLAPAPVVTTAATVTTVVPVTDPVTTTAPSPAVMAAMMNIMSGMMATSYNVPPPPPPPPVYPSAYGNQVAGYGANYPPPVPPPMPPVPGYGPVNYAPNVMPPNVYNNYAGQPNPYPVNSGYGSSMPAGPLSYGRVTERPQVYGANNFPYGYTSNQYTGQNYNSGIVYGIGSRPQAHTYYGSYPNLNPYGFRY